MEEEDFLTVDLSLERVEGVRGSPNILKKKRILVKKKKVLIFS